METAQVKLKPLFQQIWHGDSIELCDRFKPGSVEGVITDPPFGVDNISNSSITKAGKKYARKIANDSSPEIAIKTFNACMDVLLPKTSSMCDLYIFTAHQVIKEWLEVADELARHQFERKAILVWEKDGPGMGDTNSWGQGHEFIIYLKKGNRPISDKRRSGVLHHKVVHARKLIHPHQKPLPLLEDLLKTSTNRRDFVVDPFGGSGSLACAARNVGRSAVTIEKDPFNYKLAVENFEGNQGMDMDDED